MTVRAMLLEIFRRRGVTLSEGLLRGVVSLQGRESIRRLCLESEVRDGWQARYGRAPAASEVDAMYAESEEVQKACLLEHAEPIPGFVSLTVWLRGQGMRLGATTSLQGQMVTVLKPLLAARGWSPDALICASDVPAPPPAPYMNFLAATRIGAPNVAGCVVVGDRAADMEAARNAGMWAIGVAMTGEDAGLTWEALHRQSPSEQQYLRERATVRLEKAGAHVVVDTVLDLPHALATIKRPGVALFRKWQRQLREPR